MPEPAGSILERNIRALYERRREARRRAALQERMADAITRFSGSMAFVYLHLALLAGWIGVNAGFLPLIKPFDPDYILLATSASVEAIFLSTFVLISQNRAAADADERAELDLHVNLLAEHEITHTLKLVKAMAAAQGIKEADDPYLEELEADVAPDDLLDRLAPDEPPAEEEEPPPGKPAQ